MSLKQKAIADNPWCCQRSAQGRVLPYALQRGHAYSLTAGAPGLQMLSPIWDMAAQNWLHQINAYSQCLLFSLRRGQTKRWTSKVRKKRLHPAGHCPGCGGQEPWGWPWRGAQDKHSESQLLYLDSCGRYWASLIFTGFIKTSINISWILSVVETEVFTF